jgi:hypothetical protein
MFYEAGEGKLLMPVRGCSMHYAPHVHVIELIYIISTPDIYRRFEATTQPSPSRFCSTYLTYTLLASSELIIGNKKNNGQPFGLPEVTYRDPSHSMLNPQVKRVPWHVYTCRRSQLYKCSYMLDMEVCAKSTRRPAGGLWGATAAVRSK